MLLPSLIITAAELVAVGAWGADPASIYPLRTQALLAAGDRPVTIVCFGDSITGAYYHTGSKRAYCDMLGIALAKLYPTARLHVVNAGISGNTSAQGLARLERDVLSHHPDLVTIMFGINDMRNRDVETYRANMEALVKRCIESGAEVVVCTPTWANDLSARPVELQEQYVSVVKDIAAQHGLAVADCHWAFRNLREHDPFGYQLAMSDAVHPNMNGHKLIAEVIAQAIAGREVSLADVAAPPVQMQQTFARLAAGEPVRVVAMPPYDEIIATALEAMVEDAPLIEVTTWPPAATVSEMEEWAKVNVRKLAPDLVIVAIPTGVGAPDRSHYIAGYEWTLNWSLAFGPGTWDCLPVLPLVTTPALTPEQQAEEAIARAVIAGKDLRPLASTSNNASTPAELLTRFIADQYQRWLTAQAEE